MAGVSISTVSKYINGGNVLEENRLSIEKAVNDLQYQVNTVARGMKTRKTMAVGVLIPSLADYYGVSILTSIDQELYNAGYSTMICDYSQTDPSGAKDKIDFLLNKQVDGIIMQPINLKASDVERAQKEGTPIVFVDMDAPTTQFDSVTIDNADITYKITKHLIEYGHNRIGLIGGFEGVSTTDDRVDGYVTALKEAGLTVDKSLLQLESISEECGYCGLKNLWTMENRPTAVFTTGNDLTTGALMYANEKHIRIPDDLSFVGFENQTIARIYNPNLTIGIQPIRKIGQNSAKMLIERMNNEYDGPARNVRLKAVIDYGASVKKLS